MMADHSKQVWTVFTEWTQAEDFQDSYPFICWSLPLQHPDASKQPAGVDYSVCDYKKGVLLNNRNLEHHIQIPE